jgi:hypothetical protein
MRTVTGRWTTPSGTPAIGMVRFTPSQRIAAPPDIVLDHPVSVMLDANGIGTVRLFCTDNPGISPNGWRWIVSEKFTFGSGTQWSFDLPNVAGDFDLSQAMPLPLPPPSEGSTSHWKGRGRPSQSLTAAIGQIYTDLDATSGAINWIATPTGWQVSYGDTGRCDIRSLVAPLAGRVVPQLALRRVGSMVSLDITMSDTQTNPSRVDLLLLPVGFRFGGNIYAPVASDTTSGAVLRHFRVDDNGGISYGGVTTAGNINGLLTWDTVQSWPIQRPGPVLRDEMLRPGQSPEPPDVEPDTPPKWPNINWPSKPKP